MLISLLNLGAGFLSIKKAATYYVTARPCKQSAARVATGSNHAKSVDCGLVVSIKKP